MSLNEVPSGDRFHIAIFGKRNVGKSSLMNAITNQDMAVVSNQKGTTTDPVKKVMEWLPIGPVVVWDTPGIDDEGELGEKRIRKTKQVMRQTDLAIYVVDCVEGVCAIDTKFMKQLNQWKIPFLLVFNKSDLGISDERKKQIEEYQGIAISCTNQTDMTAFREKVAQQRKEQQTEPVMVSDWIQPMWTVVLVVPIDKAAPKNRLILPQQQVIRELLDTGAICVVVKNTELAGVLKRMERKPDVVITDSQVFDEVAELLPEDIILTSFSILMARKKGYLEQAMDGVMQLSKLQDGDCVLIAEGCTHHRQCEDIGTVKLPGWIRKFTKKELRFSFCSGGEFPTDLHPFKMIIHCGGCMLNEKEVNRRMQDALSKDIPFTNYGIAIAYMNGILQRSTTFLSFVKDNVH